MLRKKALKAQGYQRHSQTSRNLTDKNFTFLEMTEPALDRYEKNAKNP